MKRIISLLLALSLVLGCMLTLSSCMTVLEFFASENPDEEPPKEDENHNTSTPGEDDENTYPPLEFYPSTQNPNVSEDDIALGARTLLSTVIIRASIEVSSDSLTESAETYTSSGSGVIYKLDRENGDAYIITNFHVLYHAESTVNNSISTKISVFLYGQQTENYAIDATYIGGSMSNDIAVIKVTGSEILKNSNARAASIADSDTVLPFDTVYAVGNPEGYGISATEGIVSVESETLSMLGADEKTTIQPRVIRVSAAINEGNSGGGLFDGAGQLIGIVNAKRTGSSIDNIGYAIPSNVATRIADSIIRYCNGTTITSARKALVGITITSYITGTAIDDNGRVVKVEIPEIIEFTETSPVKNSLAVGDRISSITVDGLTKEVTRSFHVTDMMLLARVGSTVTLTVTRGTDTVVVSITVTEGMFQNI